MPNSDLQSSTSNSQNQSDPLSMSEPNASIPESNNQYHLQFLCSLIPRSFSGNRLEFNEFRTNCENAMNLASDNQKYPLLVFIISKLTGNIRTQLQGKAYKNWDELRNLLQNLFQDQKHHIQLMEDLNTLRQNFNESVSSFYERLDRLVMRIINTITYKKVEEQEIKIETIHELALSRFIHHTVPDISRFLRSQNVTSLSEALSKSIAEERALKISHQEFRQPPRQQSYCTVCNRKGHTSKSCYHRTKSTGSHTNIHLNQTSSSNQSPMYTQKPNYTQKFCKYCKKQGHLIHECRKREYANKMRNENKNNTEATTNGTNIHLNSRAPQVDA